MAYEPSKEALAFVDEIEREDDKPWDEDFKVALARSYDAFVAAVVERRIDFERNVVRNAALEEAAALADNPPAAPAWDLGTQIRALKSVTPNEGTEEFLEALAGSLQIHRDLLVQSITAGGAPDGPCRCRRINPK